MTRFTYIAQGRRWQQLADSSRPVGNNCFTVTVATLGEWVSSCGHEFMAAVVSWLRPLWRPIMVHGGCRQQLADSGQPGEQVVHSGHAAVGCCDRRGGNILFMAAVAAVG